MKAKSEKTDLMLEARLTKLETGAENLNDDIKEIKKTLRWAVGLIFGLNSTIIGLLAKGFNIV